MKKLITLAFLFCAAGVARAQMYYTTGDNGANGALYKVNTTTSVSTFVANTDVGGNALSPVSIAAMAYDSSNGILYGVTRDNSNNTNSPTHPNVDPDDLVVINKSTGAVSVLASLGSPVASMSYDPTTNTLYTWSTSDADDINATNGPLGNINFTTTPPTLLVTGSNLDSTGGGTAGIAVDSTGTIWLAGAEGDALYTVDPPSATDGDVLNYQTPLGAGPFVGEDGPTITGMTIVGGVLYAIDSDRASPTTDAKLITIDNNPADVNFGDITTIGALTGNAQAIAFVSPIPEPSTYAALLGLGSAALALARRRRVKA